MSQFPVMMFAAGFGTRMGALTQNQPKPLIKVAGLPLVDHALNLTKSGGTAPVVANLHYKPDQLQAHLASNGVTTVLEQPEILETGGGLKNALGLLGEGPVITLNTDAVWQGPNPIHLLTERWDPKLMDGLLICIPRAHAFGHPAKGDFSIDARGEIVRGGTLIYGGVQIIKTDLLHQIEQTSFSLNVLWDMMLKDKRLFGCAYPGTWCDVGHPEGIALAEEMLGYTDV